MTKKAKPRDVATRVPQPIPPKPKETERFLLIPLDALQGMIDDPTGIAKAMQIGIYSSIKKYFCSENVDNNFFIDDYFKQLCLDYIRDNKKILFYNEEFSAYIMSDLDKRYKVNPDPANQRNNFEEILFSYLYKNEIADYESLASWYHLNKDFPRNCTLWKSHADVVEYCKKTYNNDIKQHIIYCLVNLKIMNNILLNHESYAGDEAKQREYRARIAMYLGCASIIGSSVFKATTSDMIKCRMFGALNNDELQAMLANDETLSKTYDFFTTRRRYDKLLSDLQLSKLLGECPWKRRTFISLRIPDSEKLQKTVINKGKERQRKDLNERKAALREAAKTQTIV